MKAIVFGNGITLGFWGFDEGLNEYKK